jgi:hypothetical protein
MLGISDEEHDIGEMVSLANGAPPPVVPAEPPQHVASTPHGEVVRNERPRRRATVLERISEVMHTQMLPRLNGEHRDERDAFAPRVTEVRQDPNDPAIFHANVQVPRAVEYIPLNLVTMGGDPQEVNSIVKEAMDVKAHEEAAVARRFQPGRVFDE